MNSTVIQNTEQDLPTKAAISDHTGSAENRNSTASRALQQHTSLGLKLKNLPDNQLDEQPLPPPEGSILAVPEGAEEGSLRRHGQAAIDAGQAALVSALRRLPLPSAPSRLPAPRRPFPPASLAPALPRAREFRTAGVSTGDVIESGVALS